MKNSGPSDIITAPKVKYPRTGARLWTGMTTVDYLKLLAGKGFRISFLRWGMAFLITLISVANSILVLLQSVLFDRKIQRTKIEKGPIFVIGHWRSGTTLLHELLALDQNLAFPSTYECFAPRHFLLTASWLPRMVGFTLPRQRPMDAMSVSFDTPQEDEFALVVMGAPSPYFRLAFPNDPPPHEELYTMRDISQKDKARFDRDLTYFFKALTLAKKKRLILKSPTHTGRIQYLSKLFPNAKFIHISRNPVKQLSSTMRMWMIMDEIQGFQPPRYSQQELLEYCFDVFKNMYDEGYLKQMHRIPVENLIEIRFEDLTADPVEQIRKIYDRFEMPDIDDMTERVRGYFSERADYQRNKHDFSPEVRKQIATACSAYMKRYGYGEND